MDLIIAIDLGTSFIKLLAYDRNLHIRHRVICAVDVISPAPGYQELDPDKIAEDTQASLQKLYTKCTGDTILAICFSSAMHSIFPVDNHNRPLYNALIWSDHRASEIAGNVKRSKQSKQLYIDTGTPLHPMSPLFKIMWFHQHEPEMFNNTVRFISLKEYIIKNWFGDYLIDYSTASATGLFNIHNLTWNKNALQLAEITPGMLSKPVPVNTNVHGARVDSISPRIIPTDVPVYIGSTDGCLAVTGAGFKNQHHLSVTIGTSSAVRVAVDKPVPDEHGRTFNYYFNSNLYVTGAPSNNGGNIFEWIYNLLKFKNINTNDSSFTEIIDNILTRVKKGPDGLLFLPYIFGERAPLWDPEATGMFYGISPRHTAEHFMKAAIEGVLMNLRLNSELLPVKDLTPVMLSGGAFRIRVLPQMISNIFNKVVSLSDEVELSAKGAAMLACESLGVAVPDPNDSEITCTPDPEKADNYEQLFIAFKKLYGKYEAY